MRRYFAATLFLACFVMPAKAYDRHAMNGYSPIHVSSQVYEGRKVRKSQRARYVPPIAETPIAVIAKTVERVATQILPHPPGCPSSRFCGCGVSVKVFGRPVRDLYLAANWRKFPPASPAPGMVAWRNGHVFYIEQVLSGHRVLAYDPNSGRRMTRLHVRSLNGFRVVNPRAA